MTHCRFKLVINFQNIDFIFISLGDQFEEILSNNGLSKIIKNVRSKLSQTRSLFVQQNLIKCQLFFDDNSLESRILPRIWKHLQSMTCKHLCPWCGVPCDGLKTCNDLYEPKGLPSLQEAKIKHSCQFHRDSTIRGTLLRKGYIDEDQPGEISDNLPNYGNCPEEIRLGIRRLIWEPNATKVNMSFFIYLLLVIYFFE